MKSYSNNKKGCPKIPTGLRGLTGLKLIFKDRCCCDEKRTTCGKREGVRRGGGGWALTHSLPPSLPHSLPLSTRRSLFVATTTVFKYHFLVLSNLGVPLEFWGTFFYCVEITFHSVSVVSFAFRRNNNGL